MPDATTTDPPPEAKPATRDPEPSKPAEPPEAKAAAPAKAKRPDRHALPEPDDDVELVYLGDAGGVAHVEGVPAYHLSARQIDRIVYRRTVHREVPDPDDEGEFIHVDAGLTPDDDGFDQARAALVDELVGSDLYRKAKG